MKYFDSRAGESNFELQIKSLTASLDCADAISAILSDSSSDLNQHDSVKTLVWCVTTIDATGLTRKILVDIANLIWYPVWGMNAS